MCQKNILVLVVLSFLTTTINSQVVEEIAPPEYIKSIIFSGETRESKLPIIKRGEPLFISFDALNGNESDYYYTIEHYNYDWTPSNLAKAEYLEGFDKQRLRNYENSFNTLQIYSNYQLTIPNQRTHGLRVSGNYMLNILNDYDEIVFSRKFMVYETKANVGVIIKRSRDVEDIQTKQTVDITISPVGTPFNNPKQNVKTVIIQNNNLNTAIKGLEPMYTLGNELIYKYEKKASFWAGNEFLFFENKDIRGANANIQFIELKELYHNYLFADQERFNQVYTYNPDINGNFVITTLSGENPNTEADYVWVHFSLAMPPLEPEKKLHVYGNFNNYTLDQSTQLTYNEEVGYHQQKILLKQGFYNYKYVVINEDQTIDEGFVSGNFYQTENNYKVLVYYRDLGARYDKIVGMGEASSIDITN